MQILLCAGLQSVCDATQDAVCYGALGGPVHLQLMRDTTGHDLIFRNENNNIFMIRKKRLMPTLWFPQRWNVIAGNGTLIIHLAESTDSEMYTVEISGLDGIVERHTVQLMIKGNPLPLLSLLPLVESTSDLFIKIPNKHGGMDDDILIFSSSSPISEPTSDVNLSINCSANGERKAWCSSNGDSPQHSWSMDGRALSEPYPEGILTPPESLTDPRSAVLTLPEVIQGHLTCSAFNNVSSINNTQLLSSCTRLQSMCDASQDAVCYGALGGPVHLQLMRDTTGHELTFKNENNIIFRIRNGKLATKPPSQRWDVGNGTLIINPAKSTDSGTYKVEFSGSDGIIKHHTVQLMVEGISPIFISVWLAEIIVLISLLVGGYYLHIRGRTTHTADEKQEVELTPTSMSRRRRRSPEEVEVHFSVTQTQDDKQPSPLQLSPAQPRPAQPPPAQPSPVQPSPAQPSPAQPSPTQSSPIQPSPAQPSPAPSSSAQSNPVQPNPAQSSPAQPSSSAQNPAQPRTQHSPVQPSSAPSTAQSGPSNPVQPSPSPTDGSIIYKSEDVCLPPRPRFSV
ncbi:hypothetical protein ACEWY4_015578 [Coilia grayii]|uniref:Ig-like domain-containing protein n=1 Tax=Coilia grayii TaxID=363190 RepID=A0ABD1JNM6_9TELE